MIDSHCHIQFKSFADDHDEVIKRCVQKQCQLLTVGTQIDTSLKAIDFANRYENVYAIIGLHPIHLSSTEVDEEETSFVSREEIFDYDKYKELAQYKKVVGIGECGIDLFHIPKDKKIEEVLEIQKNGFLQQIRLADELNLPLSIHIRDAYGETLKILEKASKNYSIKGVIHCYTGNWQYAQKFLDIGLYLGFTGIVTFPAKKTDPTRQEKLIEVIEKCPVEKMLVETDAPYLAPQKYRGKKCEPWMIEENITKISEIKKMNRNELNNILINNTKKLFSKII